MAHLLVVILAHLVVLGLVVLLGLLGADLVVLNPALLVGHLPGHGDALGLVGGVTLLVVLGVVLGHHVLVALLLVLSAALLGVDGVIRGLAVVLAGSLGLGLRGGQGQGAEEHSGDNEEL